ENSIAGDAAAIGNVENAGSGESNIGGGVGSIRPSAASAVDIQCAGRADGLAKRSIVVCANRAAVQYIKRTIADVADKKSAGTRPNRAGPGDCDGACRTRGYAQVGGVIG